MLVKISALDADWGFIGLLTPNYGQLGSAEDSIGVEIRHLRVSVVVIRINRDNSAEII